VIEGVIVVVLLALLAATLAPQFRFSEGDSEDARLRETLHVLRGQIELYRVQHDNTPPGVTGPLMEQLTRRTDVAGNVGTGPQHRFGPYLVGDEFPANPVTGLSGVAIDHRLPPFVPQDPENGWVYSKATGELRAQGNHARYRW